MDSQAFGDFQQFSKQPLTLLNEIGLTSEEVLSIGQEALRAILNTTQLDHQGAAAQSAYRAATRRLTALAISKGWEFRDEKTVRIVTHPSGKYSLSTGGGDARTGLAGENPAKLTVGPVSKRQAVRNGLVQASLLGFEYSAIKSRISAPFHFHYLYHLNEEDQVFRSELSLPNGEGAETTYMRRLILSPIWLDEYIDQNEQDTYTEAAESDEFEIFRKDDRAD